MLSLAAQKTSGEFLWFIEKLRHNKWIKMDKYFSALDVMEILGAIKMRVAGSDEINGEVFAESSKDSFLESYPGLSIRIKIHKQTWPKLYGEA